MNLTEILASYLNEDLAFNFQNNSFDGEKFDDILSLYEPRVMSNNCFSGKINSQLELINQK